MNLLGIDIGTTGCKAAVFDADGATLALAYREYDIIRDRPGQAELDSREVWDKIVQVISECAGKVKPIAALSVASMGEALVPIGRDGRICGNSVLGTDTRGNPYLDRFVAAAGTETIRRITGQPPSGGYSLPNLCRIKAKEPERYRETWKFLPWADFVTFMLTGEIQANYSLAARTLLFDRETRDWSAPLFAAAGLDAGKLPPPVPSGRVSGRISSNMVRKLGLSPETVVVSGTHDQCAAAVGAGVCEPGSAMLGLGTYACMVLVHDRPDAGSPFVRLGLNLEPHAVPGQWVSFLYHGSGGALLKWLRREMFRDLPDDRVYERMEAELRLARHPAAVLPYFAETGPLDCAPGGEGVIGDLSFAHTRADILRSAMAGVIFYFRGAVEQLKREGVPIQRLHLNGGGAESAAWRQMTADILGIPVVKAPVRECGALGAAIIAGVGGGLLPSCAEAAKRIGKGAELHLPGPPELYERDFLCYSDCKSRQCGSNYTERKIRSVRQKNEN